MAGQAAAGAAGGKVHIVNPGTLTLPVVPASAMGQALLLDVETLSDAELVSVVCLQGLANRQGARVFLTLRQRQCHSSFEANPLSADGAARLGDDALSLYRSAPEFWRHHYGSTRGCRFDRVAGTLDLLAALPGLAKGLVRFRLSNRCELPVAVTLAGLEDAVAVPDESPLLEEFLARLPVVADIRDRFTSRLEASTWAFHELMPRCARDAVFSQNDTNDQKDPDIFSLDLAVAGRMFVFNLDFWEARAPEHFALIRKILGALEPMSPMYGWGTSEAAMMVAMGPSGTFLICTGCPNLSFHRQVPATRWPLRSRRDFRPEQARVEDLCYVAFMVNEGDTLKWMGSVMGAGRWLESNRGRIPVNWGVSPFINERYPGLMEYFYDTSSSQDVFVSSISGYGYYGLKHSTHARELAAREQRLLADCDVTVGSIYAVHGMLDATNGRLDPATEDWLVWRGCRGYIFEAAQRNRVWMTRAGQPVIGVDWSLFYWKYRLPGQGLEQLKAVAARIEELAAAHRGPSFIPVYGGSPSDFIHIAAQLDPKRFKIVGIDEMVEVARRAFPCSQSQTPAARFVRQPSRVFAGRTLRAGHGPDGFADSVDISVPGRNGAAGMTVRFRFAWDETHLHVRADELAGPVRRCESRQQAGYAAGEFDQTDGVGLWFDFDLDGTRERGDYTLWLGFSSLGRSDLWCCMCNDTVLSHTVPGVKAETWIEGGLRGIRASIAWHDLATWLEPPYQPEGGLAGAVARGYVLACQPMVAEGLGKRAFLNGRSNRRENATAAALQDERARPALPMPDGFDADSIRIQLS